MIKKGTELAQPEFHNQQFNDEIDRVHKSFFEGKSFKDIPDNINVLVTVSQQITETNFEPRMFTKINGICSLSKINMLSEAIHTEEALDVSDWPL